MAWVRAVLLPAIGSAPGIQEIKAKHGRRRARRLLLGLSLAFAGTAALAQGASPQIVQELDALEPDSTAGALPLPTQPLQIRAFTQSASQRVPPRVIVLPELADAKAALAMPAPAPGQPLKIGVARALPNAADTTVTASLLTWSRAADGSLRAAISVRSPGAKGVRLGLLVEQLPQNARLRVYAPDAAETTEIAAAEVLRTIQTNLDAGDHSADARTYWLPTVEGAEAALEIELPAGVSPTQLKVSLPTVSHLVLRPTDAEAIAKAGGSGSCNQDVMCTSGNETEMNAVAWMELTDRGSSYTCTGTLLNNTKNDRTPYLLSANHCVSSQTLASTLQTTWNYRSTSCNSNQVSSAKQTLGGGAALLYNSSRTDTSFMRLNGTPPASATFAGWNASNPPSLSSAVFGIHNPKGDLQKYSSGQISQYASCTTLSWDGSFECTPGTQNNSTFYNAIFSIGITEPGSSGSALFTSNGRQVIGQLYGGSSSCNRPRGANYYGRFDLAYNTALKTWLSPATGGSAYTVTASAGTGGTINPSGAVSVASGQTQAFRVTPNAGYYIASIKGCGGTEFTGDSTSTAMRNYTTGAITSNCTVSASFAATRTSSAYTVTASAGTGGTINPSGAVSVAPGQTQKFTVTPNPGYYVASILGCNGHWFINADGMSLTYTISAITSNCQVSASFIRYWWGYWF